MRESWVFNADTRKPYCIMFCEDTQHFITQYTTHKGSQHQFRTHIKQLLKWIGFVGLAVILDIGGTFMTSLKTPGREYPRVPEPPFFQSVSWPKYSTGLLFFAGFPVQVAVKKILRMKWSNELKNVKVNNICGLWWKLTYMKLRPDFVQVGGFVAIHLE